MMEYYYVCLLLPDNGICVLYCNYFLFYWSGKQNKSIQIYGET